MKIGKKITREAFLEKKSVNAFLRDKELRIIKKKRRIMANKTMTLRVPTRIGRQIKDKAFLEKKSVNEFLRDKELRIIKKKSRRNRPPFYPI